MVIVFLIINITDGFFQKSGYFLIKPVVYGVVEDIKKPLYWGFPWRQFFLPLPGRQIFVRYLVIIAYPRKGFAFREGSKRNRWILHLTVNFPEICIFHRYIIFVNQKWHILSKYPWGKHWTKKSNWFHKYRCPLSFPNSHVLLSFFLIFQFSLYLTFVSDMFLWYTVLLLSQWQDQKTFSDSPDFSLHFRYPQKRAQYAQIQYFAKTMRQGKQIYFPLYEIFR